MNTDLTGGAADVPHNRPWILPEDIAAVSASLSSGWLAPGPQVAALEAAYVQLHGGGEACAVSSGTAALALALRAAGVGAGDRVAVPTYVCTAVLNAVVDCDASPLLLDIEPDTFNVAPAAFSALGTALRAAIVVHTYGAPADVAGISRYCETVIEDCCQSLGGRGPDGEILGRLGQSAVCSFYATKIITAGHGGMVYSARGDAPRSARDHIMFDGRDDWKPRFNFQLSDFQAALAHKQLDRIVSIGARRRTLAAAYRKALPAGYTLQAGLSGEQSMPYRFVIRTPDERTREQLQHHFTRAGIRSIVPLETRELLHRQLGLDPGEFPNAELVARTTLSVPLYPALTGDESGRVTDAIAKAPAP